MIPRPHIGLSGSAVGKAVCLVVALIAAPAVRAEPLAESMTAALRVCAANFGSARKLAAVFSASGWRDEGGIGTPIHVFTLHDRRVIAAFTRAGQAKAACFAAADKLSLEATLKVAESMAAVGMTKHKSEPMTWVWTGRRPRVWLGVTEERQNFTLFSAYAIGFAER